LHSNIVRIISLPIIILDVILQPLYESLNFIEIYNLYRFELAKTDTCISPWNVANVILKTYFRKRLMFIVIIQDMQPIKTILHKFQQILVKRQFLIKCYD